MIHWLIYAGLVVVSFIFVPGRVDPAREPKMAWAALFCLFIGLYAAYKGKLKPFANKFAIALPFYMFVAFYLSPNSPIKFWGVVSGRFWSWEPLFYSLIFLLFLITIASIKFNRRHIDRLFDVMIWCGVVMAGLVCLQSFHLMQFFEQRFGTYGNMAGTIGNPTLIGPYLLMILPLALYKKKYWAVALMTYSTLATRSDVALAGFIAVISFYIATKNKKLFISIGVSLLIIGSIFTAAYITQPSLRDAMPDNQRFLTWTRAIKDVGTPVMVNSKKVYTVTGLGAGSFKYIYHAKHGGGFMFAHNDYVQCLYELGILGFILFMSSLFYVFRTNFSISRVFKGTETRYKRALMTSLVGICVCSAGSFTFQIGTHIYFALIIAGLLHNEYNDKIGSSYGHNSS